MTEKQERILNAALHLFAKEGFQVTSTSKVAKHAGVSEGLIFRHFENKEGLLEAIIELGNVRLKKSFASVLEEKEPKAIIRKTLELFDKRYLSKEDTNFWKLVFKIKWELEKYDTEKMKPLEDMLTKAFEQLEYQEPEKEAQLLIVTLEGLTTNTFLHEDFDNKGMLDLIKVKYNV
jgi:AcrR family transcriptional regulator